MKKYLLGIVLCSLLVVSACTKAEPASTEASASVTVSSELKEETQVTTSTEIREDNSLEEPSKDEEAVETSGKTIDEILGSFDDEISAYKAMLKYMVDNSVTVDISNNAFIESDSEELARNKFAITDIDKDGKIELIIDWSDPTVMACYSSYIVKYDVETDEWIDEEQCGGAMTFFDNGVVYADASHNQGYGMTIWPHTVLKYEASMDCYKVLGFVDSMDKINVDAEGVEYPSEHDPEGVGTVYILLFDELGYPYGNYSQAEYYELLEKIIGEAKTIEVDYRYITKENVKALIEE